MDAGSHMAQLRSLAPEQLNKIRGLGAKAKVWTPRMLAALVDGVEGRMWCSLMDKVHCPATLKHAWEAVQQQGSGRSGQDWSAEF
jgi:hypothetical protein